jgi:hypothetical protein
MITNKLMKTLVTLLMILLVSVQVDAQVFGKKKSKNADPRDAQIDSLTTLTKNLTLQVDSLSLALGKYAPVPDTLKVSGDTTSVLAAAAIPASTPGNASAVPVAAAGTVPLLPASEAVPVALIIAPTGPAGPDSLAILRYQNKMLMARIDSVNTDWGKKVEIFTAGEVIKATAVNDLKKLKELLDAQIITVAEFTVLKKKYLEKL